MKFRSTLPDKESSLQITHNTSLLAMGSCFADRIGEKLSLNKFPIEINPLGISYNPVSIARHLSWILGKEELSALLYQKTHDRWHSFDVHSSLSRKGKVELEAALEKLREDLFSSLKKTKVLMLTFGTARVYRLKDTGAIVANNYAYPASLFSRELLKPDFLSESVGLALERLWSINPTLQVLISLSPVRHIRDGLEENALSKAHLRILCQKLVEQFPAVHYFPAYEIMMDDLRDYRFYKADLIHPNEQAEAYIWEFFTKRHMPEKTLTLLEQILHIRKDLAHKAFNPSSPAHQAFLNSVLKKIDQLPSGISFDQERKGILEQLGA